MAYTYHRVTAAVLLLFCLIAVESTSCPEDSVKSDDGECKCVSPCSKPDCPEGEQPELVREAIPEKPGRCCALYECRNQALNWLATEATEHQCRDSSGEPHEDGEHWQESDPCVNCVCTAGVISCQTSMCRGCAHSLPLRPGECCPKCQQPATRDSCPELRGCKLDCKLGFDTDKTGCSVCRCITTIQNEVAEDVEEEEPEEKDDEEDEEEPAEGRKRTEGEEETVCPRLEDCKLSCEHGFLADARGCSICRCRSHPGCPAAVPCQRKCPQGYRTNKRGCASCRCRSSCVDERNVTHPEGSSWRNEPCRSCFCELGGQISCNETVCSVACRNPEPPPPGLCCPICPPTAGADESRGWGTVPIVLIVVLALLCIVLMVHLVRGRFRARLAPSEAEFATAGFPQQYYTCVPVYESHVPVLRHAEKIAPL